MTNGNVYAKGNITSIGPLSVASTTNVGTSTTGYTTGALVVTGGIGVGGNVFANGDFITNGNVYAKGDITALDIVYLTSTTNVGTTATGYTSGALVVTGGVGVGGNVFANGDLMTNGNVYAKRNITSIGNIFSNGDITTSGNIIVSGNVYTSRPITTNYSTTLPTFVNTQVGNITVGVNSAQVGLYGNSNNSGNLLVLSSISSLPVGVWFFSYSAAINVTKASTALFGNITCGVSIGTSALSVPTNLTNINLIGNYLPSLFPLTYPAFTISSCGVINNSTVQTYWLTANVFSTGILVSGNMTYSSFSATRIA
jgi:hypothetical protein